MTRFSWQGRTSPKAMQWMQPLLFKFVLLYSCLPDIVLGSQAAVVGVVAEEEQKPEEEAMMKKIMKTNPLAI